ncbi:MAG: hypothetical protein GW780_02125 [Candidatus Aenigmarchaeota archaeon]|nr:hypothetical protein [Candidatus Aenigmarchaeota archaeon]NCS70943.1 hypothetical protein [Candidatus Aenigmarchaeota archaeon]
MAKKKKDEMTLMREKALNSGRIVNTQRPIDPKIRSQLLKNYGLFVRKYSD